MSKFFWPSSELLNFYPFPPNCAILWSVHAYALLRTGLRLIEYLTGSCRPRLETICKDMVTEITQRITRACQTAPTRYVWAFHRERYDFLICIDIFVSSRRWLNVCNNSRVWGSNLSQLIFGSLHDLCTQSPHFLLVFILQSWHVENLERSSVFIASLCQILNLPKNPVRVPGI